MTKIFSLFSTWTNRRQPWGRWTTVDWGSTSRFFLYWFYSIYAELWTYKFSFNHLIDIFMQYCCKKAVFHDSYSCSLRSPLRRWKKQTAGLTFCHSSFTFVSITLSLSYHFHIAFTFISLSLSYHFHFHITFISPSLSYHFH